METFVTKLTHEDKKRVKRLFKRLDQDGNGFIEKVRANKSQAENKKENTWILSRKQFIRTLLLAGVASQLPFLNSCSEIALQIEDEFKNIEPLNQQQFKIVRTVQSILFPEEGDGPGAFQINADKYLVWVLNDPLIDPKENQYIMSFCLNYVSLHLCGMFCVFRLF